MKNLITEHPDIVERLDAKLKIWCETLKPPGPPIPGNKEDETFYAAHVDKTEDASQYANHVEKTKTNAAENSSAKKNADQDKADVAGSVQGWACRNGTISVKEGALALTSDDKAQMFLTCNGLKIPGPVMAVLRLRAGTGGKSSVSWRTSGTPDFILENSAAFDWPASKEWQDVKTELHVNGSLIHIRINPGKACAGLEIQSIELRGKDAKPQLWRFDTANSPRK